MLAGYLLDRPVWICHVGGHVTAEHYRQQDPWHRDHRLGDGCRASAKGVMRLTGQLPDPRQRVLQLVQREPEQPRQHSARADEQQRRINFCTGPTPRANSEGQAGDRLGRKIAFAGVKYPPDRNFLRIAAATADPAVHDPARHRHDNPFPVLTQFNYENARHCS
jgi:hypothetical protein